MNREHAEAWLLGLASKCDVVKHAASDPTSSMEQTLNLMTALGAIAAGVGDTIRAALDKTPAGQASYTCPICQAVSYNPHDASNRYCGRCHVFEDDANAAAQITKRADRLVSAFIALREAFELAGMATPLAVVLPAGEVAKLAAVVRDHSRLLIEDRLSGEPSVWGIRVLEGEAGDSRDG